MYVFDHFVAQDQVKRRSGKRELFPRGVENVRGLDKRFGGTLEVIFQSDHRASKRGDVFNIHAHTASVFEYLAFDAVAGPMTRQLLDALPEHSRVTVYSCLSHEAPAVGHDHLIFEDKAVNGFWLGPWINKMNLLQILMLWRRAQKLMASELKSDIRAQYPFQEAKKAVQDYLSQMTGGKILLIPEG